MTFLHSCVHNVPSTTFLICPVLVDESSATYVCHRVVVMSPTLFSGAFHVYNTTWAGLKEAWVSNLNLWHIFQFFLQLTIIRLTIWLQIKIYLSIKTSLFIKVFIYKEHFINCVVFRFYFLCLKVVQMELVINFVYFTKCRILYINAELTQLHLTFQNRNARWVRNLQQ